MAVQKISGPEIPGVSYGTAPGDGSGYVVGFSADCALLKIDSSNRPGLEGLKFYHHPKGDVRKAAPEAEKFTRMTMLVSSGNWQQSLWLDGHDPLVLRLTAPGDFIVWTKGVLHTWEAIENSTMLTLTYFPK